MRNFAQSLFKSVVSGILLVLLTGGVILDVLIVERLEKDFDELLIAKSMGLIALAEDGDDGVEMENYEITLPKYALSEGAEFFELVNDNNEVVISSESLSYWQQSPHAFPTLQQRPLQKLLNVTLPDGVNGRLLRTRFVPRLDFDEGGESGISLELDARFLPFPGQVIKDAVEVVDHTDASGTRQLNVVRQPLTLQLGVSRQMLDSLIKKIHVTLFMSGLSVMILIVMLARKNIQSAVMPLRLLTSELDNIDDQYFGQRLTNQTSISEFNDLTTGINSLLERVESAIDRERSFSGDVAHELRTPITELKTLLEVSERWPNDPTIRDSFTRDAREITERMQRIVETLLSLSRSEQIQPSLLHCDNVNLLLNNKIELFSAAAHAKRIQLINEIPDQVIACTGRYQWESIITNLLENALDYSPEGSIIKIILKQENEQNFSFIMQNEASDLDESDLDHLFERLWRKDAARTSGNHSGLGLPLVRACVNQIGAKLKTSLDDGKLTINVVAPIVQGV